MRISDGSSDVCSSDLVVRDGAVDRGELGRRVFGDGEALRRLERIIHPRVYRAERRFIARAVRDREAMVVRDVDRQSVVEGKSVSVRVDLGGRRISKKKQQNRLKWYAANKLDI